MPTPELVPLNSFNSVGQSSTANLEIPGGQTIDEIVIEYNYSATASDEFDPSHIPAVRLNLNTEDIIDVKASDLITVEQYKQGSTTNGFLVIPLAEIIAKTYDGMNMTGLVTFPSDAISLEVETSGARATSNDVTLTASARFSAPRKQRVLIPKMRRYSYAAAVAGDYEITNLARGPRYRRLHFLSGDVNSVKLFVNRVKRYHQTAARNSFMLGRHGKTPQASTFHMDFVYDDYNLAHSLVTEGANSMEFVIDMAAAGSVPILAEFVETVSSPRAAAA